MAGSTLEQNKTISARMKSQSVTKYISLKRKKALQKENGLDDRKVD
jgi:hypothetical protein